MARHENDVPTRYNTSQEGVINRTGLVSPDCTSVLWNDLSAWQCAYESAGQATGSCPPPASVLDVHIVCHTHDDTGYLSTVDECVRRRLSRTPPNRSLAR